GAVEGDMAQLVRDDPGAAKLLVPRLRTLEHFHDGALGVIDDHHLGDRGLGILLARRAQPVRGRLLVEGGEIVLRTELEADARASRLLAAPQDHGMMIVGVGEIGRVALLGDEREAENIRVVLGLLVEIGRLVAGVRYLPHSDHGIAPFRFDFCREEIERAAIHRMQESTAGYFDERDCVGAAHPRRKTLTATRTVSSTFSRRAARGTPVSQPSWCSPISMSRNSTASRYGSSSMMRPAFCCFAIQSATTP